MAQAMRTIVEAALQLWQKVTEHDPEASRMRLSDWSIRETFTELQEALDIDHSQVTAILLLASFAEEYLKGRKVDLYQLLMRPEDVQKRLANPRALLELLSQPEVCEARADFVQSLTDGLAAYGAESLPGVCDLLAKPHELALLRRDALRSMAKLKVEQFLRGAPEPEHSRPVYNRTVHQWWNVNSMLAAAPRMPSGVSLNLIRHPHAFQSYFCFLIRNGANVYVLTDAPDVAHPLQGQMSRRPDRALGRRAQQNWFPYGLMDLKYDEESCRLYEAASSQRALVAHQIVALPLKPVIELEPAELVWTAMMFNLVVERFWAQGWQAESLAYTAEMLQSEAFHQLAKSTNLPALSYTPLSLPPLTREDLTTATEAEVGKKYHSPNEWLERRFGSAVPEDVFNLLAPPDATLFLGSEGQVAKAESGFHGLPAWEQEEIRAKRVQLAHLDVTRFGSREQLDADRKFIARVNYAKSIDKLAAAEFAARKNEVRAWYAERIEKNFEQLWSWAGCTELWIYEGLEGSFSGYRGAVGPVIQNRRNFVARRELSERAATYELAGAAKPRQPGVPAKNLHCVLTGAIASFAVVYYPGTSQELALLAGCQVTELPDVLQNWTLARPYTGNSILDRVDPMLWCVTDPWLTLNLRVALPLSKRGMAQLLKLPVVEPPVPNRCPAPT